VRIDRLQKNYEIDLLWTAFPLHPETPEDGLALEELLRDRGVDLKEVATRLKRVAAEAGLPLGERDKTYNSRLAQELGKWAEEKGRGEEFHNAVFRAYFVDGVNIAKIPELLSLAKSVGLPDKEAQRVLEARSFRQVVDRDWSRARAMGITAVPTFLFNERTLVGAQPYEVLERFLIAGGARKRS
jgi:predicted DsbA family dithiol-disulfide isomerase